MTVVAVIAVVFAFVVAVVVAVVVAAVALAVVVVDEARSAVLWLVIMVAVVVCGQQRQRRSCSRVTRSE